MSQVIVFPRGQLMPADRARMEAVGIVAVEADDPATVVTVVPGVPLATSDDLAMAALAAVVTGYDSVSAEFVKVLHKRLLGKEVGNG